MAEFDEPKDAYLQHLEEALEKARMQGDENLESRILLDLGFLHVEMHAEDDAIDFFETGLDHLKKTEQYAACMQALLHLAKIYRQRGNHERAFGLYTEIIEYAEKIWDKGALACGLASKGQILIEQKAFQNGFELMFRSFQILEEAKLHEAADMLTSIRYYRRHAPPGTFELALHHSQVHPQIKTQIKENV